MYTNKKQWYQALEETLGLEPSDLDDLAGILMETLPEALNVLEKAQVPKDELRRHAHSIKGSAGNLGLHQLAKLADDLETLILNGRSDSPEYQNKLAGVKREYEGFVRLMEK